MRAVVVIVAILMGASVNAQQPQSASRPPVPFVTDVAQVQLPEPPEGYVWHRIEELQVAVITPPNWKRLAKDEGTTRVVAFSPGPLNQNNQFDMGLTARLLWHPQSSSGNESRAMADVLGAIVRGIESNKADNKVLRGRWKTELARRC